MAEFTSSNITLNSESVSDQLKKEREAKKIKLEDVAQKLNINIKYLKALEEGHFLKLPKGVYGKNFLREYSNFLGLDTKELLNKLDEEMGVKNNNKTNDVFSKKVPKPFYFLSFPKIAKNIILISILIIFVLYLSFYLKNIISPPLLIISNPPDNYITTEKFINILGQTDEQAEIEINGEIVLIDSSGYFQKKTNLKNGLNTITITAKKKYSKTNEIIKKVLVNE